MYTISERTTVGELMESAESCWAWRVNVNFEFLCGVQFEVDRVKDYQVLETAKVRISTEDSFFDIPASALFSVKLVSGCLRFKELSETEEKKARPIFVQVKILRGGSRESRIFKLTPEEVERFDGMKEFPGIGVIEHRGVLGVLYGTPAAESPMLPSFERWRLVKQLEEDKKNG